MNDISLRIESLTKQIDRETHISKKYWLKQARMHYRAALTNYKAAGQILNRMASHEANETNHKH